MILELPDDKYNALERGSIERLLDTVRGMHYANILVHTDGRDTWFEADWLKYVRVVPETE